MQVQILQKAYGRKINSLNLNREVTDEKSSKEICFGNLINYAGKFFATTKGRKTKTADDWLRLCVDAKCGQEEDNIFNVIRQLSRNESRYFSKVFPRGFQKALALGFIIEKKWDAFHADGVFNLDGFKKSIQNSTLLANEKGAILANLDDKYFRHITYLDYKKSDGEHPEVKFGNTEYKNVMILPGDKFSLMANMKLLGNSQGVILQPSSNIELEQELRIRVFMSQFCSTASLNYDKLTLTPDGLYCLESSEQLMSLDDFVKDEYFLSCIEKYTLSIDGVAVDKFFTQLKRILLKIDKNYSKLDDKKKDLISDFFSKFYHLMPFYVDYIIETFKQYHINMDNVMQCFITRYFGANFDCIKLEDYLKFEIEGLCLIESKLANKNASFKVFREMINQKRLYFKRFIECFNLFNQKSFLLNGMGGIDSEEEEDIINLNLDNNLTSTEQQIQDFFIQFANSGSLSHKSFILYLDGLFDVKNNKLLMNLNQFINHKSFLSLNDFSLKIEGLPANEFFNKLEMTLQGINQYYKDNGESNYIHMNDKERLIDEIFNCLAKSDNQEHPQKIIESIKENQISQFDVMKYFVKKHSDFNTYNSFHEYLSLELDKLKEIKENLNCTNLNKERIKIFSMIIKEKELYLEGFNKCLLALSITNLSNY
jgi:hypothetical protein